MLLTDAVKYLFVRNGQYIKGGGDLDDLDINLEAFWSLVENDFLDYERYFPLVRRFNIMNFAMGGAFVYDFTYDHNNPGYQVDFDNGTIVSGGNPPEDIPRVVPVGSNQMIANWSAWRRAGQFMGQFGKLVLPRTFKREYRKPILYLTESGQFDVTATYKYQIIETRKDSTLTEVEIVGFDKTKIFMDLLSGRFLQLVGRSRRAFTYQDLQITTDAEDLVREGIELYREAQEQMYQRHEWYRSINH